MGYPKLHKKFVIYYWQQLLTWSRITELKNDTYKLFSDRSFCNSTELLTMKSTQGTVGFLVPGNTQKILTEIWHHFWLKMMMKSGIEKFILKFHGGLQRYLLTCQANSAFLGRFFCTGQQQLWRPSCNFKINNF